MYRREYLSVVGLALLSGCSEGGGDSGGFIVRDDSVFKRNYSAGQEIAIGIENVEGLITSVVVNDPDLNEVSSRNVETSGDLSFTTEMDGTYEIWVVPDGQARVSIPES